MGISKAFIVTIIAGLFAMTAHAQQPTLVERLGYPANAKLLIVHADDFGMSHNVNTATQRAMTDGWVSSASVMVPCPWFSEAVEMARQNPDLDIGIHLTLNSEWKYYRWGPVAPAAMVPGLIDKTGFLHRGVQQTATSASPQEVENELRAQVRQALDFGLKPTHVDSHMGTVFTRPAYFQAYRKIAHEFELPYLVPRLTPELMRDLNPAVAAVSTFILAGAEKSGDIIIDHLKTDIDASPEKRTKAYIDFIRDLKPGVTQVIVHCGEDSEELRAITSRWEARVADARAFTDPAVGKALEDNGVVLIGWRALQELRFGAKDAHRAAEPRL